MKHEEFSKELSELMDKYGITTAVANFSDGAGRDVIVISGTNASIMIAHLSLARSLYETLERRYYGTSIGCVENETMQ